VPEPFRYFLVLIASWIAAWLLYEATPIADLPSGGKFVYWTVAKIVIWIAPIIAVVRYSLKQPLMEYLGLVRFAAGVRGGLVVGAVFNALSACLDVFTRSYAWPGPSWGQLSVLTVAPLFEEVMFRGFVLRTLEDRSYRFWTANLVAALMFLGLHLPGWYFMGSLGPPQVIVGASIVIIGLVAGYAKRRSGSTWASVTVHLLVNLYSSFLR
jgi:membrane protease YdiL (CAAX protease family)